MNNEREIVFNFKATINDYAASKCYVSPNYDI